jgi:CheY-like chemotaxis protein
MGNENMNRSIYVVDDESLLLETLVLGLRSMGREWEVTGFGDSLAALEAVKKKAPDAVLTDHVRLCGLQPAYPYHVGAPIRGQAI